MVTVLRDQDGASISNGTCRSSFVFRRVVFPQLRSAGCDDFGVGVTPGPILTPSCIGIESGTWTEIKAGVRMKRSLLNFNFAQSKTASMKWPPTHMDFRNFRGVTGASTASWVGIEYLMEWGSGLTKERMS
ncbi:hypothetical protein EVAR_88068_1 [Eumeta japonica]|uniref:Uncharacterized protein n=1 Tax=Eumeta variegata TaxID=151549 RepID=A0A4C1WGM0_EUMVA|nr:hypothetical protein EVAR_88068_1 [Eumeta japonica]